MNIVDFLKGKKSYGVAGLICAVAGAFLLGWIDFNTAIGIVAGLLGVSVATLRAGIDTAVKKATSDIAALKTGGVK